MSLGLVTRALAQGLRFPVLARVSTVPAGSAPTWGLRAPAHRRDLPVPGLSLRVACRCCCRGDLDAGCVPTTAGSLGELEPAQTAGSLRALLCGPGRWTDSRRPQALCGLRHSRPAECSRLNRPVLVLDGIPPSSSSFTIFVFTNFNVRLKGCFDRG